MKRSLLFALATFVVESAFARGWHSSSAGPDWLYKMEIGVITIFLLFFLIKKPVKTIGVLVGVVVLPVTMLLTVGYLDKNFGIPMTLIAIPLMWLAILKFIDLVFKDDGKK